MDLSTQPGLSLEALLLRHHSAAAAAASSLWTCLAAAAAAFYFWRVRSSNVVSAVSAHRLSEPSSPQRLPENLIPPPPEDKRKENFAEVIDSCQTCYATKGIIFEAQGCSFEEEEEEEGREPTEWGGAADGGDGGVVVVVYGSGMSRRDLGWYKYQNLAALNGNIVRLWDDEKRRTRF